MKKLLVITGIILTAYLGLTTALSPAADAPAPAAAALTETTHSGYLIGESDGRVAVFRDGVLYLRTETTVSSLPKADRVKIEKGITVDSLKELKSLLQDLCS